MKGGWRMVGVSLLFLGCERVAAVGGFDLRRMLEQPRYDAYERSRFFADEKVMQRPPEGTVPRERSVGRPLTTRGEEGGRPAGQLPVPVTAGLLELGRSRFEIFCAVCHGAAGYGGSVVAENMEGRRPPSLRTPHVRAHAPGHFFRVITEGFGRMPSYAAELPVRERWAVIAYLQRLQETAPARPEELADSILGERLGAPEAGAHAGGAAHGSTAPVPGTEARP